MRVAAPFAEILTTTSTKTLVQVSPGTNHPVKIDGYAIFFKGIDNLGEPIQVDLLLQTTAGTSSTLTPKKLTQTDTTSIDTSALETFTVEPTAGDVLLSFYVHPQSGVERRQHEHKPTSRGYQRSCAPRHEPRQEAASQRALRPHLGRAVTMRVAAPFAEILTTTSTKTLVQVSPGTNHPVKIDGYAIFFKGIDNLGEPIQVDLLLKKMA